MATICTQLDGALPRISGRRNHVVDLNVDFLNNGVLTDPYAIRYIEIYKTQVLPHNLITTIPVLEPTDELYPAPLCREYVDAETGQCGTEPSSDSEIVAGKYHLPYSVPADALAPDVYFDVWYYYADNPCGDLGTEEVTGCALDDEQYDDLLLRCCHRFWVYPDEWYCDDKLQTIRFAFEPLDQRFQTPEIRPLEVGLMPLPLYDYNFNLVNPLIPYLRPTISIETMRNELLVDGDACEIAIRQGSYRSNPFVVKYLLDTSLFLKGTYQYQITLALPDGSTRVSGKFVFTIS